MSYQTIATTKTKLFQLIAALSITALLSAGIAIGQGATLETIVEPIDPPQEEQEESSETTTEVRSNFPNDNDDDNSTEVIEVPNQDPERDFGEIENNPAIPGGETNTPGDDENSIIRDPDEDPSDNPDEGESEEELIEQPVDNTPSDFPDFTPPNEYLDDENEEETGDNEENTTAPRINENGINNSNPNAARGIQRAIEATSRPTGKTANNEVEAGNTNENISQPIESEREETDFPPAGNILVPNQNPSNNANENASAGLEKAAESASNGAANGAARSAKARR